MQAADSRFAGPLKNGGLDNVGPRGCELLARPVRTPCWATLLLECSERHPWR
jgi:hypothetical protein